MLGKARRGGGWGEKKAPGFRRARRKTGRETRMAICNTLEGWIEGLGDVNLLTCGQQRRETNAAAWKPDLPNIPIMFAWPGPRGFVPSPNKEFSKTSTQLS